MVDKSKIKRAVNLFLEAIGEDVTREGLIETPYRVAKMCEDLFCLDNSVDDVVSFKNFSSSFSGSVLVKDIKFCSLCEHHLMPFFGTVHVAYVPDNEKIVGISKIARVVNFVSKRLQVQENLTETIADVLMSKLEAKGVIVLVAAVHMCMVARGVKQFNSKTITLAKKGVFKTCEILQNDFFRLVN